MMKDVCSSSVGFVGILVIIEICTHETYQFMADLGINPLIYLCKWEAVLWISSVQISEVHAHSSLSPVLLN